MADIAGMLDELQHKTAHNPEWKARFLASREEADPISAFCRICREFGYEIYEMDLISQNAYAEIGHYFRQKDPRHERENRFFERLGYIDLQYLAPRIRAEVLMLTGLMDTTCPPSTQFAAYNKITAPKKYLLYPEYGHEALPQFDELAYSMMRGL